MSDVLSPSEKLGCLGMVTAFFGVATFILLIIASTATSVIQDFKTKAVELHAAEWVVNPKDGTTSFQWKEPKP